MNDFRVGGWKVVRSLFRSSSGGVRGSLMDQIVGGKWAPGNLGGYRMSAGLGKKASLCNILRKEGNIKGKENKNGKGFWEGGKD